MVEFRSSPAQRASAALLCVVAVGSVLPAGAVHPPVFLTVSAVAIIGLSIVLWTGRRAPTGASPPALILLGLALWSALQAFPLPIVFLARVAPRNADVWGRAVRPLGEPGPSWAPVSLDPGASLLEASKWATYAVVFLLAERVGRRWGSGFGVMLAFASAVIVALVTLVHGLVGAHRLFGVYTPQFASPVWGVAPLLNPNNLSGYLNLGALCGVGVLITRRAREESATRLVLVSLGLALVAAASALAASRGGTLALGIGVLVLAGLVQLLRHGYGSRRLDARSGLAALKQYLIPGVALAAGLLLAGVGARRATWDELENTSAEKLQMFAWTTPVIRDHPWLGIGRGAFETTFPAYRERPGHVVFAHPENFVVQWLAEWGVPATLIAAVLLAWTLRPSVLGATRNRVALAGCVGVGVVLVQNLVDLALEVPAITIALSALLGALRGGAYPHRSRNARNGEAPAAGRIGRPATAMLTAAAALGLWAVAVTAGRTNAAAAREQFHRVLEARASWDASAFAALKAELRRAMLQRPGEPYFPMVGALVAHAVPGEDPMPWIAAALERDPMNGRSHLLLARILAQRGAKRQALMELRLAVEREPSLADAAGKLAVRLGSSLEELADAAPSGPDGARTLLVIARELRDPARAELRSRLLEAAIERDPSYADPRVLRAEELLDAAERRTKPCEGDALAQCRARIEGETRHLAALDPRSCVVPMLRARLLQLDGKPRDAIAVLAEGCVACQGASACQSARVALAARHGDTSALRDAIRAMVATACATRTGCADGHRTAGETYARRQDWVSAADHYARAAAEGPTAEAYLVLAEAAIKAGSLTQAENALRRAEKLAPTDPQVGKRIEKLRQDATVRGTDEEPPAPPVQ